MLAEVLIKIGLVRFGKVRFSMDIMTLILIEESVLFCSSAPLSTVRFG
jgi:hypothetical protein